MGGNCFDDVFYMISLISLFRGLQFSCTAHTHTLERPREKVQVDEGDDDSFRSSHCPRRGCSHSRSWLCTCWSTMPRGSTSSRRRNDRLPRLRCSIFIFPAACVRAPVRPCKWVCVWMCCPSRHTREAHTHHVHPVSVCMRLPAWMAGIEMRAMPPTPRAHPRPGAVS